MANCREAFENSLGHTDGFHDGYVTYNPITGMYESNDDDYECVADWLNGALSVWQSRQAEINQLQSQINEMAEVGLSQESELNKKDEHAHNLFYENANLQALVEEKDKRINQALNFINNWWHPDLDQKLFVEALGRALRGHDQFAEHRSKAEQQINNGARLTKHQIDL